LLDTGFADLSANKSIRSTVVNQFIRKSIVKEDSLVRELSVQLWSVNQRTTETKEVTDSQIRTKSVTVKEKTLVVQEGMEIVLGSHRL
jgi:hypothetical protein